MTPRHPHLLPAESGPQALVNSGHHRYYLARHIALRACRLAAALGLVATACHSLPEPRTLDAGRLGRVELRARARPSRSRDAAWRQPAAASASHAPGREALPCPARRSRPAEDARGRSRPGRGGIRRGSVGQPG